ncbi:MAG: nucleoside recognition protein [Eubacteriales bacterium]|nr:nucleoside recognition protein [Eubacteriales bacterium]
MTYLWSGMILIGIFYGTLTGNLQEVTDAAVASSKEAIQLAFAMAGITAMWTGLMKIAEKTGLVAQLSRGLRPVLKILFPRLSPDSKAGSYISLNFLANFLGLGWAATPAGLKAMEELEKLKEKKGDTPRDVASSEMCTFLILNISSLQLIPVNIIAYRAQYGSVNPTAIVGPGILATAVSTAVAVVFCKVMDRRKNS